MTDWNEQSLLSEREILLMIHERLSRLVEIFETDPALSDIPDEEDKDE